MKFMFGVAQVVKSPPEICRHPVVANGYEVKAKKASKKKKIK